jgi:hypothetical protein
MSSRLYDRLLWLSGSVSLLWGDVGQLQQKQGQVVAAQLSVHRPWSSSSSCMMLRYIGVGCHAAWTGVQWSIGLMLVMFHSNVAFALLQQGRLIASPAAHSVAGCQTELSQVLLWAQL